MRTLVSRRTRSNSSRRAAAGLLPPTFFTAVTFASFRLDSIEVTSTEVIDAVSRAAPPSGPHAHPIVRSRLTQRIRNHISILRHIESSLRHGAILLTETVIRWYTSISYGLSTAPLDEPTILRLDSVVQRVNSPQLRLQPAVTEIAHLHSQLISDPFVPSFNGILARLLLQFHLGRCGLPPVMFNPDADQKLPTHETRLLRRLLEMIEASYGTLLEVN